MTAEIGSTGELAVTCPHCHKPFTPSARHRGYKCPHCRLFVPLERTDAPLAGNPG